MRTQRDKTQRFNSKISALVVFFEQFLYVHLSTLPVLIIRHEIGKESELEFLRSNNELKRVGVHTLEEEESETEEDFST